MLLWCSAEASVHSDRSTGAGCWLHPLKTRRAAESSGSEESLLFNCSPPRLQQQPSPCRCGRPAGGGTTWPRSHALLCTPERTVNDVRIPAADLGGSTLTPLKVTQGICMWAGFNALVMAPLACISLCPRPPFTHESTVDQETEGAYSWRHWDSMTGTWALDRAGCFPFAVCPHSQDGRLWGGQQMTPRSRWPAGLRGHSDGRYRPEGQDQSVHVHGSFCGLKLQMEITSIMFITHSGFPSWQAKGESADGTSCKMRIFIHLPGFQVFLFFFKACAYFGVSERHQGHSHDVLQHAPGGEELLADEDSAAWTQTLIIQSDGNRRDRPVRSGSSQLHTLLLNLKTSSSI